MFRITMSKNYVYENNSPNIVIVPTISFCGKRPSNIDTQILSKDVPSTPSNSCDLTMNRHYEKLCKGNSWASNYLQSIGETHGEPLVKKKKVVSSIHDNCPKLSDTKSQYVTVNNMEQHIICDTSKLDDKLNIDTKQIICDKDNKNIKTEFSTNDEQNTLEYKKSCTIESSDVKMQNIECKLEIDTEKMDTKQLMSKREKENIKIEISNNNEQNYLENKDNCTKKTLNSNSIMQKPVECKFKDDAAIISNFINEGLNLCKNKLIQSSSNKPRSSEYTQNKETQNIKLKKNNKTESSYPHEQKHRERKYKLNVIDIKDSEKIDAHKGQLEKATEKCNAKSKSDKTANVKIRSSLRKTSECSVKKCKESQHKNTGILKQKPKLKSTIKTIKRKNYCKEHAENKTTINSKIQKSVSSTCKYRHLDISNSKNSTSLKSIVQRIDKTNIKGYSSQHIRKTDLRYKLSRQSLKLNKIFKQNNKHDNRYKCNDLVITVNNSKDNETKVVMNTNDCTEKVENKIPREINLIINVIYEQPRHTRSDYSESSFEEDKIAEKRNKHIENTEETNKIIKNTEETNKNIENIEERNMNIEDLSFLDDFNVDEIAECLNYDENISERMDKNTCFYSSQQHEQNNLQNNHYSKDMQHPLQNMSMENGLEEKSVVEKSIDCNPTAEEKKDQIIIFNAIINESQEKLNEIKIEKGMSPIKSTQPLTVEFSGENSQEFNKIKIIDDQATVLTKRIEIIDLTEEENSKSASLLKQEPNKKNDTVKKILEMVDVKCSEKNNPNNNKNLEQNIHPNGRKNFSDSNDKNSQSNIINKEVKANHAVPTDFEYNGDTEIIVIDISSDVNKIIKIPEIKIKDEEIANNSSVYNEKSIFQKRALSNDTSINLLSNEKKYTKVIAEISEKPISSGIGNYSINNNNPNINIKNNTIRSEKNMDTEQLTIGKLASVSDEKNKETSIVVGKHTDKTNLIIQIPNLTVENKCLEEKLQDRMCNYFAAEFIFTSIIKKGRFSQIFQFRDSKGRTLAVKLLNHESNKYTGPYKEYMLKAMQKDIPRYNLNCVYLIDAFSFNRCWCFVMEFYPKNLRQALEENQKSFHINVIRGLARQLISAVMMLRDNNIVHLDIKPEHILLNSTNDNLKLCGFDCADYIECINVLPNVGTVNYRSPEIILGYNVGFETDVWATALILYEMATNKQLFPGSSNNDILFKQMCTLGSIPNNMLQRCLYARHHFDGPNFRRKFWNGNEKLYDHFYLSTRIENTIFKTQSREWNVVSNKSIGKNRLYSLCRLLIRMLEINPANRLHIQFIYDDPFVYQTFS